MAVSAVEAGDRMPAVKNVGEPYEGEPHVRFDGGELETGLHHGWREWAPGGNAGNERRHLPCRYRASSLPYRRLGQYSLGGHGITSAIC